MSDTIVIEALGKPRGKQAAVESRHGATYTPQSTREYMAQLKFAAQVAMNGRAPLDGPLVVEIEATIAIPKSWPKAKRANALFFGQSAPVKPDYDNIAKMMDALNQIVWVDDRLIVSGHVMKRYGDRPGVRITVKRSLV